MIARRLKILLFCAALAAGCVEDPPPRSVSEFMDDAPLLEAALLRCSSASSEARYDPECVNAREAVKRIETANEAARRAELEALSQRKREALRRTQQAAAEARRRAAERERVRREADYEAQFGVPMPADPRHDEAMAGNEPLAVIPAPGADSDDAVATDQARENADTAMSLPAAGSNAPVAAAADDESAEAPADLGSIREELKRRSEEGGSE
jgi:hypothetical protein